MVFFEVFYVGPYAPVGAVVGPNLDCFCRLK